MAIDRGHGIVTPAVLADSYDLDGILAKYEEFDDLYLGKLAVEPTTDNDGDPLQAGALYFNSVSSRMRVYDGTNWDVIGSSVIKKDTFVGDGSTTVYALTIAPTDENTTQVYVDGLYIQKNAYSVLSNNLTFAVAPADTSDIEVMTSVAFDVGETDSDKIAYTLGETGSITTDVEAKLQETVSIKDFGGVCDGATNDADALILALATGRQVIIPQESAITLSTSQVVPFIENLNLVSPKELTTFNLPAGEFNITTFVELNNQDAVNIKIVGNTVSSETPSAITYVSGSAKDHLVKYTVGDTSNMAVDDYVILNGLGGTGQYKVGEGCFKITTINSATQFTVKHTLNDAWPTLTVISGTVFPINTVLRWANDSIGLRINGCSLRELTNVIVAGSFNISTTAPADSASDGIQVGSAPNTDVTGLNESEQTNAGSLWSQKLGIVEWEGNGLQVLGGNFYGSVCSASSNGWRGFQAGRNGSVAVKSSSACGNGASGYEAEELGFVLANNSSACGNAVQGVYAIGSGVVSFASGFALNNQGAGIEAKNFGTILADTAHVKENIANGVSSTSGNILFGSSSRAENNTGYDVYATEGGLVNANGSGGLGVTSADTDSGSNIISAIGDKSVHTLLHAQLTTGQAIKIALTSLADTYFSADYGSGFGNTVVLKNSGTFYPYTDDSSNLGRSSNRWDTVYATTGTINTSDERDKQQVKSLTDQEKTVATNLKNAIKTFKFNSAVSKKGDSARIHTGIMAQEVVSIFTAEGLDATNYGILCYDEWEDEINPDTGDLEVSAGNKYGVRYEELLAFIISAL